MICKSLNNKKILILIIQLFGLCLIWSNNINADTLTVKLDGTGDFTLVQNAINESVNSDIILVYPGTYYENIKIENKNIVIGSLSIISGNLSYMYETIIDGNANGSCMEITDCNDIEVIGFTIMNGWEFNCSRHCGSGVRSIRSNIFIKNCLIQNNGGTWSGAGIYTENTNATLSNVTVRNNHADVSGGGIYILESEISFDTLSKCNIYNNYAATGTDLYKAGEGSPPLIITIDTFTVINPDHYYAYSHKSDGTHDSDIYFNIINGYIEQTFENIYVSNQGNNSNSGLSQDEPLKNIWFALLKAASDTISPDTICIAPGTYSPESGERFPIGTKLNVSLNGESIENTFIDADFKTHHLTGVASADNYQISDLAFINGNRNDYESPGRGSFYIKQNNNLKFTRLCFENNQSIVVGVGSIHNSNGAILNDVIFRNNSGGKPLRISHGHGLYTFYDTVQVINCQFYNNHPDTSNAYSSRGGGISVIGQESVPNSLTCAVVNNLIFDNHSAYNSNYPVSGGIGISGGANVYLINSTIVDNTSENSKATAIGVTGGSTMHIFNSIVYNNEFESAYMYNLYGDTSFLTISNSLIDGGEQGVSIYTPDNVLNYNLNNINTDPLFYYGPDCYYNLSDNSPCIDAGTLSIPDWIELPELDLVGNPRIYGDSIDMGAYEWNPTVGFNSKVFQEESNYMKISPNPFSISTKIELINIPKSNIKIIVYNSMGQEVSVIAKYNDFFGSSNIEWFGQDKNGHHIQQGYYLIVLYQNMIPIQSNTIIKVE